MVNAQTELAEHTLPKCPRCAGVAGTNLLDIESRTLVSDETKGILRRRRVKTYAVRRVQVPLCLACIQRIGRLRHIASFVAIAPLYVLAIVAVVAGGSAVSFAAGLAFLVYALAFLSMLTWSWADVLVYGGALESDLSLLIPRSGPGLILGETSVRFPAGALGGLTRFAIGAVGPVLLVAASVLYLRFAPASTEAAAADPAEMDLTPLGASTARKIARPQPPGARAHAPIARPGAPPPTVDLAGLHQALREGRADDARTLLDRDPGLARSRYTALAIAPLHGVSRAPADRSGPLIAMLVEHGAEVDAVDQENATPLHYAAGAGRGDVVRELADRGASLTRRRNDGATPLVAAVLAGSAPAVEALLDKRADPNDRTTDGRRPLAIALARGDHDVITLLKKFGAEP